MESKDLMILFVWIFVLVVTVGLFWTGEQYVAGIGGPYVAGVFLFFVALIFTGAVVFWSPEKKEPETGLVSELQNIRSRLDELTREVEETKKTIETS